MSKPLKPVAVADGFSGSGNLPTSAQESARPSRAADAGGQFVVPEALAPAFTYECDENLTVVSVSPSVAQLLGIRKESILGNRTLWDKCLVEANRGAILARVEALKAGELTSETHQIIDDCGLPIWVAHGLRKVRTDTGVMIRGCMIPLRTEFQSKVLDSEVIAQFVHKIGNHFQLINLLIDSLKRAAPGAKEIDALQESVDRAVEFTRTFSYYSQIAAHSSPVDLGEILRGVIDSSAAAFLEKKVKLEDRLQGSLDGAWVKCDPALMDMALRAILQNALEATEAGGQVIIDGAFHATSFADRFIAHISIGDTGCGMEQTHVQKAPAPFFTSKSERDGLGLSIAARVVELQGGRLTLSSTKDRGTEVELVIPLHAVVDCSGR